MNFHYISIPHGVTRWCSYWDTALKSRKVAGSIPDGGPGIFHWHNPSGRTMVLGLTRPLIEMSTGNISWGVKAADAYGWQPSRLHVLIVSKSGSLNLLEPSGLVQACNGVALPWLRLSNPYPLPFRSRLCCNYWSIHSPVSWFFFLVSG